MPYWPFYVGFFVERSKCTMIIHKILNNNVIVSKDENDQEMIVMGRGITFGKKLVQKPTKYFI